jgi:hypothetical protein
MVSWEATPPQIYSIVTGFFPETSPKDTWATNPRPLLVCGVAQDAGTGMYFCRIAYGTSKTEKSKRSDLIVANLSMLDSLNLKCPTRFVIHSGRQMVIMPWTTGYFQPWTGKSSPILSCLPDDVQRYVGHTLSELNDLPLF